MGVKTGRPRGRPPGFKMPDEHRSKISTGKHLNNLDKIAAGEIPGSPLQVKAIEILLRKTMPDLANVQHTGDAGPVTYNIITGVPRKEDK
jgi:hypothetical protein